MNIKKIIQEEVNDFSWVDEIDAYRDGDIFFIVDSGEHGKHSNTDTIRFIVKLGERFVEDGVDMYEMYEVDGDTDEFTPDLEYVDWVLDNEGIEMSLVSSLISTRYWRPWSERGVN